ncbi:MAG: nucleoside phosphorylase [Proteobacteria bacterium]|nr:nucleoside phosphorylase [Desulfocapsa sp.]MBU3945131.1 nucleoside phosphorylase [Pseudomonadota bacterium]MCG2743156.1 nucleoside phosphorylase [Desulfobacteraceae bacterium]MBU4028601.1 nucleoside phosphorylase [Pseudomonadota bacterium]MBU4043528.1 nucleoside phosphorylase [Pseudomonadota bacterium]
MSDHEEEDVVMHPLRGRKEKVIPAAGIFFVNPAEATSAMNTMITGGGKKRFLFNSMLCVYGDETFFVAGPAVGAPMAVLCMEKLIVLGARRIILVGWCGALQQGLEVGSVLLPGQALCGEGTSHYYSSDQGPKPSAPLISWLRDTLSRRMVPWQEGRVWSTDAPYRESRDLLARLHKEQNIVAIDMEYSALCTVALFRGIEFASLMLVSDELWQKEWKSGFSTPAFRRRSQEMSGVLMGAMQSMPHVLNGA